MYTNDLPEENTCVGTGAATSPEGISSELLINVIRTLTSTASDEQRQLERERIQHGYKQSEKNIDKLLREHRTDVMQCLNNFQSVSRSLTNSREQVKNVKNSLSLCKTFLQCRRDDLNKFWLENTHQTTVCDVLRQMKKIRDIDKMDNLLLKQGQYIELIKELKAADILLRGPLMNLEGISQLKFIVSDKLQNVFNHIVNSLLQSTIIEPFEIQMLTLAMDNKLRETKIGISLIEKYQKTKLSQFDDEEFSRKRFSEFIQALSMFDQIDSSINAMFSKIHNLLLRLSTDTAKMIIQLNHSCSGSANQADTTQLVQFVRTIIAQLSGCSRQHEILSNELQKFGRISKAHILKRFWDIAQEGLEEILSEHLNVWRNKKRLNDEQQTGEQRRLFRFEHASFVSCVSASAKKQVQIVCSPNVYNIVSIFHKLFVFCQEIEKQLDENCCKIRTYISTVVAEEFFEQIRVDLELKTEKALTGADIWAELIEVQGYSMKVLKNCVNILELCGQINDYITNMEPYALRFASFWLLILEHFIKAVTEKYSQITMVRQPQGDFLVDFPKLSAAWVVDEDIARLLKSLPCWAAVQNSIFSPSSEIQTPFSPCSSQNGLIESEQEIRERTQRESEILIGNLGTQKQLKQSELITNMENVKILTCLHETLQWFIHKIKEFLFGLSSNAKDLIETRIHINTANGVLIEQMLCDALNERINNLEKLSDNILLVLHLELRFHCFFHLLPIAISQNSFEILSQQQEEMDRDVLEFGRDLTHMYGVLQTNLSAWKLKYMFDGLGYLCSSIFIYSCQSINKLSEIGHKRICRAIFTVQKYLSQLSGRPETDMQRAQFFFDLLNKELDQLFSTIIERGASFSFMEYTFLLALMIRSHPQLHSQPGALETATKQLREILSNRSIQ